MKGVLLMGSMAAVACSSVPPSAIKGASLFQRFSSLEMTAGQRLGVALVDPQGRLLAGHRSDERFAFCSTFKLLLASMVLDGARQGLWSLDEMLPVAEADLVVHSPVTRQHTEQGSIRIRDAASAIVIVSDNAAANLLLRRAGGIDAFNRWLAEHGDRTTRLDRLEPALNENRAGDPRDTTTPHQIATTAARLLFGDWLAAEDRALLREWLVTSRTGLDRIRGGLPSGVIAGDKTGTCGGEGRGSYNDVAYILPAAGAQEGYILAVYLDRPKGAAAEANAAIAQVARTVVPIMAR